MRLRLDIIACKCKIERVFEIKAMCNAKLFLTSIKLCSVEIFAADRLRLLLCGFGVFFLRVWFGIELMKRQISIQLFIHCPCPVSWYSSLLSPLDRLGARRCDLLSRARSKFKYSIAYLIVVLWSLFIKLLTRFRSLFSTLPQTIDFLLAVSKKNRTAP